MTARTNKILIVFESAVLLLFLIIGITAIANGTNGATFSLDPLFNPDNFSFSLVLGATSIAVLSFLGFDAISTLSEESKGGPKTIGRGMVFSLLIVGVLFIVRVDRGWASQQLLQLCWPGHCRRTGRPGGNLTLTLQHGP